MAAKDVSYTPRAHAHLHNQSKSDRQKGVAERAAFRATLTPQQQLEALSKRPGDSKKETERLLALIPQPKASKPESVASTEPDTKPTTGAKVVGKRKSKA